MTQSRVRLFFPLKTATRAQGLWGRSRLFASSASGRFFFFQAEDGIRDYKVTGVQTCALPILAPGAAISQAIQSGAGTHGATHMSFGGDYGPTRHQPTDVHGDVDILSDTMGVDRKSVV